MDLDRAGASTSNQAAYGVPGQSAPADNEQLEAGLPCHVLMREMRGQGSSGYRVGFGSHLQETHTASSNRACMYRNVGAHKYVRDLHCLAEASSCKDNMYAPESSGQVWHAHIAAAAAANSGAVHQVERQSAVAVGPAVPMLCCPAEQQQQQQQQDASIVAAWACMQQYQQIQAMQPASAVLPVMQLSPQVKPSWNPADQARPANPSKHCIIDGDPRRRVCERLAEGEDAMFDQRKQWQLQAAASMHVGMKGRYAGGRLHMGCTMYSAALTYVGLSTRAALEMANGLLGSTILPGNVIFCPVSESSLLFQLGHSWGFTAYAICLGSSYFQRLVNKISTLELAVRNSPKFVNYVPFITQQHGAFETISSAMSSAKDGSQDSNLQAILFTCVYLATKMVDRMPYSEMLQFMLGRLHGGNVTSAQAYEVEAKCLEGLEWRLGPYFLRNNLPEEW